MTPPAWVLVSLVRAYQWTIRPLIGPNCRFWPSCSEYAVEAVRTHGALTGSGLAARRILRCNPWHPGGYDPVPPCACEESSGWARAAGCSDGSGGHWVDDQTDKIQQRRKAATSQQRPRAALGQNRLQAVVSQQQLLAAEPHPKAL